MLLFSRELRMNVSFPPGFSLTWHRIGVKRATSALAHGSRKTGGCPVRYRRFYTRLVSAPRARLGRDSRYRWKTLRRRCMPCLRSIPSLVKFYSLYFQRKSAANPSANIWVFIITFVDLIKKERERGIGLFMLYHIPTVN